MTRAVATVLLLVTALAPSAQDADPDSGAEAPSITIVARSSPNENGPENTLAAAHQNSAMGATYVEVDVRTSADGLLYLMHDPTVDRTTDGKGAIQRLPSSKLDILDAGSKLDPLYTSEPLPRLEDYLTIMKDKVKVCLNLLSARPEDVAEVLARTEMAGQVLVRCETAAKTKAFHQIAPDVGLIVPVHTAEGAKRAKEDFGATVVTCALFELTDEFVAACRDLDLQIMVDFDGEKDDALMEVIDGPADLVRTSHPERFSLLLPPAPLELPEPEAGETSAPVEAEPVPEDPSPEEPSSAPVESSETVEVEVPEN